MSHVQTLYVILLMFVELIKTLLLKLPATPFILPYQ